MGQDVGRNEVRVSPLLTVERINYLIAVHRRLFLQYPHPELMYHISPLPSGLIKCLLQSAILEETVYETSRPLNDPFDLDTRQLPSSSKHPSPIGLSPPRPHHLVIGRARFACPNCRTCYVTFHLRFSYVSPTLTLLCTQHDHGSLADHDPALFPQVKQGG